MSDSGDDDEYVSQSGVVELYNIISSQVDVHRPLVTLSGDKELARFGDNVLVSSLDCVFHAVATEVGGGLLGHAVRPDFILSTNVIHGFSHSRVKRPK